MFTVSWSRISIGLYSYCSPVTGLYHYPNNELVLKWIMKCASPAMWHAHTHTHRGQPNFRGNISRNNQRTKKSEQLTIKSHVFSKRLTKGHFVTIFNKLAYSKSIFLCISAGETLVSHIKKREDLPWFDDTAHFSPLFWLEANIRHNLHYLETRHAN